MGYFLGQNPALKIVAVRGKSINLCSLSPIVSEPYFLLALTVCASNLLGQDVSRIILKSEVEGDKEEMA